MAEDETRSYNILTVGEEKTEISRKNILTREFVVIRMTEAESDMESIFEKIDAYGEKIKDAVVFVELAGIKKALLSVSKIEEYVQNKGAVVARVGDKRILEQKEDNIIEKIVFRDPDEIVAQELKNLDLTEVSLSIDRLIRDTGTAKSRIDDESETLLKTFLGTQSFEEEYKRESLFLNKSESAPDETRQLKSKDEEMKTKEMETEEIEALIRNFKNAEFDETREAGETEETILEDTDETEETVLEDTILEDTGETEETPLEETGETEETILEETDETEETPLEETIETGIFENNIENKTIAKTPPAPVNKRQPKIAPRQYTLGDMFGAEDEK
ncbi:MAG: hypothetical protein FWE54_03260 [Methanimicrococcus sp.]|nr:hypothetical protein [Methanimicrococcus sp.]